MSSVNHPKHYNIGGVEAIDVIDAWGLGFELGNTVKYIARVGHKGDDIEDLEKAEWYLKREIDKRKALRMSESIQRMRDAAEYRTEK